MNELQLLFWPSRLCLGFSVSAAASILVNGEILLCDVAAIAFGLIIGSLTLCATISLWKDLLLFGLWSLWERIIYVLGFWVLVGCGVPLHHFLYFFFLIFVSEIFFSLCVIVSILVLSFLCSLFVLKIFLKPIIFS